MASIDCRRLAVAGLLAFASGPAAAVLITITGNTNWSAISPAPTAADTIVVKGGATLTVNTGTAVVGAITLGAAAPSAGQGTLNFSANTSQVTLSTAAGQAGTLTLGSGGQAGNLNMANGGTLILVGFVSSTVGTFTRSATGTVGTVELTGTNTLPGAAAYNTFNNLTIDADSVSPPLTSSTTQAQATTINGNLVVNGTLKVNNALTVAGSTTVGGILSVTTTTGNKTFAGPVTLNSGSSWCVASTQCNAGTALGGNFFIQGNFSNSAATFIAGGAGSVYTFNGGAAQTLSGSSASSTFANVTLNNANGLSLGGSHNLTVSTSLTLTAGKITTGANVVYVSNGSTIAAAAGRFIEGNLKKPIPTGTNVAESFEVGGNTGANYSPVNLTFASVTTGGDVTVSSTAGAHPQLGNNSGISITQKLNRWWTISNGGVVFTTYTAAFTYVAAEIDTPAAPAVTTPAAFATVRWDGTSWNASAVSGTPTSTALTISGEAGFGDFAIGEPQEYNFNRDTVGRFNAYDPAPLTPANSLHGFIRTKTAGTAFTLTVIHFNTTATGTQNLNKESIRVDVMDASNTGGTYTNNCSDAWTVIQTLNTAYTSNSATQDITLTVNNAYPSVRIKVTRTSGGTESACSTDRFAVKPSDLLVQAYDTTWQTAGTSPATDRVLNNTNAATGNVHAASTGTGTLRPFTVRATGRTSSAATTTNYTGSPTIFSGYPKCGTLPSTGCTVGTLTLGGWGATTGFAGVRSADAHYSEAGTFKLSLEDRTFANVDIADTSQASRTISQAGPSPNEIEVGRFVPDHFDVSATTAPTFQTFGVGDASCTTPSTGSKRSFTYVGQAFGYTTTPVATIVAKNGGNGTVTNYKGALWRIGTPGSGTPSKDCTTNADVCTFTTTWNAGGNASKVIETYTYTLAPVSTPNWDNALTAATTAAVNSGTGAISFASSDNLAFLRSTTTPLASFTASITNTIAVEDDSESGISITTSSPATFSSIAFDSGNEFRYGRLRMVNAYGTQAIALPVGIETQYWNGSAFQLNAQDNCTTLARSNITLGSYGPNLDACETAITQASVTFTGGTGRLYLTAPSTTALTTVTVGSPIAAVAGSVLLTPNLGSTASGNYCASVGAAEASAVAASKLYLRGAWTGATYTENPSARGTFGFYGAQPRNFIFFRENY